LYGAKAYLD
jgi:hypothetical protein